MKKEDILALDEFRETYGDKAADALVQYLTKKRKDLTAHEVLEDDGAFERFSNWAYTKLGIDVYENFAKHDVGGFTIIFFVTLTMNQKKFMNQMMKFLD